MNLQEGTRRLALLLGVAGAIFGGFVSYLELQTTLEQRARHNKFEQLATSDVIKQVRKSQAGWVSIDPKTGERTRWDQQVDKGGIKTIHWTKDNEIESIETEDEYVYAEAAPAWWSYALVVGLPFIGFIVPWGVVRAIGWVGIGFFLSSN